jgi:hypothetical protein
LAFRGVDQRGGSGAVNRIEDQDLDALGDHGVGLLLLLVRVAVRVLVKHLATAAEFFDLGLEQRAVLLLIAGGGPVRHQEGDFALGLAAIPASAAFAATTATAGSHAGCQKQGGGEAQDSPCVLLHRCSSVLVVCPLRLVVIPAPAVRAAGGRSSP